MTEMQQTAQAASTLGEPTIKEGVRYGRTPYDQQWLGSILRPALIAILVGCLDVAILSLLLRFNPAFGNGYAQVVVGISLFAVLLACATTTWLAQPERRQLRRPIFRLAEIAFVLVVARLLVWMTFGGFPGVGALLYEPLATLFNGAFLFAAIVIGASWLIATAFTEDMLRLALQPDELFAIEEDRIGELIRTSNSDRPAILQRLTGRWVAGGILLVLIAASVRIERPDAGFFAITRQNIDPTIIAAVVIYFIAGLVLLSQGQLAILRTRWLLERIPTSKQVLGQWPIYVIALLLFIGFLAALLPFGGTFLLAQIITTIISFIFNTLQAIFRFFMGLLLLLIAALAGESPPPPEEAPAAPLEPPPLEEMLPQANSLPAWTGGALFWIVMTLFLGYAAYIYLNDKGIRFTWLSAFWQLLLMRWRSLFSAYQVWQRTRIRTQQEEEAGETSARRRRNRTRRGWQHLNPTQRVRYFYLMLLEQAKTSGAARAAAETPGQYAQKLSDFLEHQRREESREDDEGDGISSQYDGGVSTETASASDERHVQALTTAFVRTRYANGEIGVEEATQFEKMWQELNKRLRSK